MDNEENSEIKYHKTLSDYYQYHSKNRDIARRQACYHLFKLNDRSRLYDFLKSKECLLNLPGYERSRYLNVSVLSIK